MDVPKPLQDLILSNTNQVEDGIAAFRSQDYKQCIKLLSRALDKNKTDWRARMYLSMAYYTTGATFPAISHLKYLQLNCPDDLVKEKSAVALASLEERVEEARKQQAAKQHYGAV
jgi:cytochrome c-type biogenesis protein CcmH/NrfG